MYIILWKYFIIMDLENKKCVIIIDSTLKLGIIANVASILSITLGNKVPQLVGPDVLDRDQIVHLGLTKLPIPVLGASAVEIASIRNSFLEVKNEEDMLVDFTSFAQQAKTYDAYRAHIETADTSEIMYLGIAIFADRKATNKSTKGLALIR